MGSGGVAAVVRLTSFAVIVDIWEAASGGVGSRADVAVCSSSNALLLLIQCVLRDPLISWCLDCVRCRFSFVVSLSAGPDRSYCC